MTPRDRRALKWGAALLVVAIVGLRAVPRVLGQVGMIGDRVNAQRQLLARGRWQLAQADALEDSVRSIQQAIISLAPELLSGGDPVTAAESLESVVIVAASGGAKIEAVNFVSDSMRAGRLRRATIRTTLESDLPGLLALLGRLSSGHPTVRVLSIQVTAANPEAVEEVQVLRAQLLVEGWFLEERAVNGGEGE